MCISTYYIFFMWHLLAATYKWPKKILSSSRASSKLKEAEANPPQPLKLHKITVSLRLNVIFGCFFLYLVFSKVES